MTLARGGAAMTDLTEFLLARIAEDEAVARATEHPEGPETLEWRRGGKRNLRFDNGARESYEAVFAGNWARILVARDSVNGGPLAEHIARWDPARVLAECEARRRIVTEGGSWCSDYTAPGTPERAERVAELARIGIDYEPHWPEEYHGYCDGCAAAQSADHDREYVLRLLVLPYVDHPDYDETWRP